MRTSSTWIYSPETAQIALALGVDVDVDEGVFVLVVPPRETPNHHAPKFANTADGSLF
jgi:hypothetical protein